jgi:hypothetical protein
LENIEAQKCYYSLEIPVNEFDYPVFVDQNAGARGVMNIVNSVLPNFVASYEITFQPDNSSLTSNSSGRYLHIILVCFLLMIIQY